jgi:hypothetical protein
MVPHVKTPIPLLQHFPETKIVQKDFPLPCLNMVPEESFIIVGEIHEADLENPWNSRDVSPQPALKLCLTSCPHTFCSQGIAHLMVIIGLLWLTVLYFQAPLM